MSRKKLVKLECDNPSCDRELVIEEYKKRSEIEDEWKEIAILSTMAKHDPEPTLRDKKLNKILCPECSSALGDLLHKFFDSREENIEIEWDITTSTEEMKR